MSKDEKATALIEAEIRKGWPEIVQSVTVTPYVDYLDEPALSALVELRSVEETPGAPALGAMLAQLRETLTEHGDTRNPRIGFRAPDFKPVEDDDEFELDNEEAQEEGAHP